MSKTQQASTQTVFPPRSPGNNWAYWRVDSLADLPAATKRRRNTISFIATKKALAAQGEATCCYCHQPIAAQEREYSIYGEYNPRTKRAKLWHYPCGWGALLDDIIVTGHAKFILVPETIQL